LSLPYAALNADGGFGRTLDEARFVADWRAYFASAAHAHSWMLAFLGEWREVLFPGFVEVTFAVFALATAWRAGGRRRELVLLYGSMAALAFWLSFGPTGGLYSLFYHVIPAFSFLRAPARFGLLVVLALSIMASIGVTLALERCRRATLMAAAIIVAAVAESIVPIQFDQAAPIGDAYKKLASLPDGALLELPVYSRSSSFFRTWYMLGSTAHWKPLVNAYSDYTPPEFSKNLSHLGGFPSNASFRLLERDQVRYALFHLDLFKPESVRHEVVKRLDEFNKHLKLLWADDNTRLYEIRSYP
jgi:hypothetical protein